MVFAFKEAEWRKERKKLKEELKRLRKAVEEKDERIRVMEDRSVGEEKEMDCTGEAEEEMIEELKMEVRAKEGCIKELKARLVFVENEEYSRAREVDILRQSLKIM
ncbi:hypothetical protein NC653_024120 [Populus alba x Populus x berolinensis]|uniref:Uncharacterized protein n=1 Tax=Populus alba x Populus x berolinensis TaxID=444605 RepID=A0AAD6Q6G7_9ROSI|nr:hypothetical protein NC653_024120 [Populus alba x Populus x berolinensis]